jgi:hypothetical protein
MRRHPMSHILVDRRLRLGQHVSDNERDIARIRSQMSRHCGGKLGLWSESMPSEKQPEEKELVEENLIDAEYVHVPEPTPPSPTARWRGFLNYLLTIAFLGGIAYWVFWTRTQDQGREKEEKSAADIQFKDLTARYGPNALVENTMAVVDADDAISNDGELHGWSVVDEKGQVVCTNPKVEATVRLLHCDTVGHGKDPQ